ncbi:autotransporter domain-containing protein [Pseudaminobacter soli (ex Li et al. 2025)]|uniref:autotransporter domain-containing protein n=1 Tax=Pseudaminobacter soli (ex Li et al. 2025) TaxID=1295366 RepID=UPI0015E6BDDA|nr:autotransporter domain-containing protein [Mesorhizobium soli]
MQGRPFDLFEVRATNISRLRRVQSLLAGASLTVLALAASARAETTTYTDGQNATTPVAMTVDTELNVAAPSSAQQNGIISGDYHVTKTGGGTLSLNGANTYSGGTTIADGAVILGRASSLGTGSVEITNGAKLWTMGGVGTLANDLVINGEGGIGSAYETRFVGTISGDGRLLLSSSGNLLRIAALDLGDYNLETGGLDRNTEFVGKITGSAGSSIMKTGTGAFTLGGDNSGYGGSLYLRDGRTFINDDYRNMNTVVTDGVFGGSGRIGDVIMTGGTPEGSQNQPFTMASLSLGAESHVFVRLEAGSDQAPFNVTGDLTLNGTVDVEDAGGFGPGIYSLFNYGGKLTDLAASIRPVPDGYDRGDLSIQTAMEGRVNLVAAGEEHGPLLFWDGDDKANWDNGKVDGGDGQWRTGGRAFTDAKGAENGAMNPRPGFVVFGGKAGNVEVYTGTGQVQATGMQFATSGYKLYGDMLTIVEGEAIIRVGDGSAAGADYVATISNRLDGGGRLTKTDLGRLILDGENAYWGGTEIRQGTLQIGSGGTSGSIVGDVVNNGVLAFNRSDETSFDGAISGTGAVHVLDGELTLTATNSYTGGTIVDGGRLRAGTDGAFFADTAYVVNDGTLDLNNFDLSMSSLSGAGGTVALDTATLSLNQGNDTAFAGSLTGSGYFLKAGSGKLTLSGDSAGYSGHTSLGEGTLAVNGQLGGSLDVLDNGRLTGTGTVGRTIVNGTIAPGSSIGTLNVAGDITFNGGSVYEAEVNAAGDSDRIVATGSAALNGGSVRVLAGKGNYAASTQYMILSADGGVTGTFEEGVTSNLAFLDPSLSYDDNNVYLTMTRNGTTFENVGLTRNQIATGGGVESLGAGNAVYDAVLNLSASQARGAFDQLSGEIHASAKSAMIEDSRFVRSAVNDRLRAAFDGVGASGTAVTYENSAPQPVAANTDRFALWSQGFGSWGHTNGDGNAARLNRSTGGFFVGADAPVFDTWRFGAVAGYSHTSFDAKDRHSLGSNDSYYVGLYGGTAWGDLAFRTGSAYTWHDISTSRNVAFPGFSDSLKGDYNAGTAQVFGELAYGFSMGAARFEPFANLAYVNLHTDGFRETGGAAALTSASANTDTTFTTLGLRASTSFELNGASVTARGTLGWRHAFDDVTPTSTMRFAGSGNAFTIAGVPVARDAAVVEAGLDFALTPNTVLGVTYDGQFGLGTIDQSFKASFSAKY